jgi:hypothetical protein
VSVRTAGLRDPGRKDCVQKRRAGRAGPLSAFSQVNDL